MLARVYACAITGLSGTIIEVEVDRSPSEEPKTIVVGLPDTAVQESKERVRGAIRNSGLKNLRARITVNLAPADLRKEGPCFDLPIAIGELACRDESWIPELSDAVIVGELSLDGSVRHIRGVLLIAAKAREMGFKKICVPACDAQEAALIPGIDVLPVHTLRELYEHFTGIKQIDPLEPADIKETVVTVRTDFSEIKGQEHVKRALEIAAAGSHNVLMIGPPGSGKTLMARCMPTILPDMTFEEALESTRIHSVAGIVPPSGLLTERPFRSPHHTASHASLVGGGPNALPGEISKAHNGVLFLDELPEYRRDVLEALRQPMEDGFVTITRVNAQSTYPSRFMLVCSMNPCPCGNLGSRTQQCRCTPPEIRRYLNRISGPLLDRIDMHIEVESIPAEKLSETGLSEASAAIRQRVEAAREVQLERYRDIGIHSNAELNARTLAKACRLTPSAHELLLASTERLKLSNRAYTRILKVARTIADLDGFEEIDDAQIAEAVQYRTLDRKYWG